MAHWLECRTRNQEVLGSSPRRSSGRIFFSMVSVRCPIHPRVTAVARKRSPQNAGGRLQLNAHTPYLCGFELSDTVNWCIVEWCTHNLRRDGGSFTWHQPCNNQIPLSGAPFGWILKIRAIKGYSQSHIRHDRNESARQQRIALYIKTIDNNKK